MFSVSRRSLLSRCRRLPTPTALSLLVAVPVVAALMGAGLTQPVAAEPITVPAGDMTPENFASSCGQAGGQLIEIHGENGGIGESSCTFSDGSENVCNWAADTCTFDRVEPTAKPFGDVGAPASGGVVLADDPPTPTAEPTLPTDATAESATTDDATAPPITPTEPAGLSTAVSDTAPPVNQPSPAGRTTRGGSTAAPLTGPGSLTLVSTTCAAGYDLFAEAADPEEDCTERVDGLAFLLDGPGIQTARVSGQEGSGTATFAGLADGTYRLRAMLPAETAFAFILACESNARSFDGGLFRPMAMVMPNGAVGLTLQSGEDLTCAWYDVQAAPPVEQ